MNATAKRLCFRLLDLSGSYGGTDNEFGLLMLASAAVIQHNTVDCLKRAEAFIDSVAEMMAEGECENCHRVYGLDERDADEECPRCGGPIYYPASEDAISTMNELIASARQLRKLRPGKPPRRSKSSRRGHAFSRSHT